MSASICARIAGSVIVVRSIAGGLALVSEVLLPSGDLSAMMR